MAASGRQRTDLEFNSLHVFFSILRNYFVNRPANGPLLNAAPAINPYANNLYPNNPHANYPAANYTHANDLYMNNPYPNHAYADPDVNYLHPNQLHANGPDAQSLRGYETFPPRYEP
jgi:hypothetical protein